MIDIATLQKLLSRPRTRPWVQLAHVIQTTYESDAMWVEVRIPSTEHRAICRVASSYVVPGGGLWIEPTPGSQVLVVFPSDGFPGQDGNVHPDLTAGIIVGFLQNDEEVPPETADRPAQGKMVLALDAGHALQVRRKGEGTALVEIDGQGNINITSPGTVVVKATTVQLGDGQTPIARIGDIVQAGPFAGTITAQNAPLNPGVKG
jgi:hypothetical protein